MIQRAASSVVLLLGLLLPLCALGQTPLQARQEMRQRMMALLDQWEQAAATTSNLQYELTSLEKRISAEQHQFLRLEQREEEVEKMLEGARAEEAPLQTALESQRRRYYRQLRSLYLLSYDKGPNLLAPDADFKKTLQRLQTFTLLLAAQHRRLSGLRDCQRRLSSVQGMLALKQNQLEELKMQAQRSGARLAGLRGQRAELLARLEDKKLDLIDRISALQEAEARLARAFALPADQQERRPLPAITAARGHLSPPVRGKVTSNYSPQRRGITIKAAPGAEVRAPWGGEVAHTGQMSGLGKVVVLDHGESVFSVLGHLSDLAVNQGQKVLPGEVLGNLGSNGLLYLEVRQGVRPVNPGDWLRLGP